MFENIQKGSIVYRHTAGYSNEKYVVTKVTKKFIFVTAFDSKGIVEYKYNKDTGKPVNSALGCVDYITTVQE